MVDRTGLTDADWAEINKRKRAHDAGGDAALSKALDELDKDLIAIRIIGAFYPDMMREPLKTRWLSAE